MSFVLKKTKLCDSPCFLPAGDSNKVIETLPPQQPNFNPWSYKTEEQETGRPVTAWTIFIRGLTDLGAAGRSAGSPQRQAYV